MKRDVVVVVVVVAVEAWRVVVMVVVVVYCLATNVDYHSLWQEWRVVDEIT